MFVQHVYARGFCCNLNLMLPRVVCMLGHGKASLRRFSHPSVNPWRDPTDKPSFLPPHRNIPPSVVIYCHKSFRHKPGKKTAYFAHFFISHRHKFPPNSTFKLPSHRRRLFSHKNLPLAFSISSLDLKGVISYCCSPYPCMSELEVKAEAAEKQISIRGAKDIFPKMSAIKIFIARR